MRWLVVKVYGARTCTLEVHKELHVGGGGDAALGGHCWHTVVDAVYA